MAPEGQGATLAALSLDGLRAAWNSGPMLITVTSGPEHVLVFQNDAAVAVFGAGRLGAPLVEAFPELAGSDLEPLAQALRSGRRREVARRRVGLRDVTGKEVVLHYAQVPVPGPDGASQGLVFMAIDVTAEVVAERAAAEARLLAELSQSLTAARSAATGLQALADALVPKVADLAAIYVLPDADGDADAEPVPPQFLAMSAPLTAIGPPPPPARTDRPSHWDVGLRAGRSLILPIDERSMPTVAPDPAAAQWLRRAAANAIAVVPLAVAGRLTGAMVLLSAGEREPYEEDDLPFLEDVAARAGAAIGQVARQQRQREVALRLQRALLPAAPPPVAGMEVAARYVAGAPEVEIGGDWWDLQDLGGGRIAVGIGDVAGRGVSAAAVMGQARAVMHAAGRAGLPPAEVLHLLDAQLREVMVSGRLEDPAGPQFATACYAVIEPGRLRMCASNAGHLPLLVRSAAGEVRTERLPPAGPLGLLVGGFAETVVPLRPGDLIALYTDGLVEIRGQDLDEGIAALASVLARLDPASPVDLLADRLLAGMSGRPGYGQDDVALVLLRITADR